MKFQKFSFSLLLVSLFISCGQAQHSDQASQSSLKTTTAIYFDSPDLKIISALLDLTLLDLKKLPDFWKLPDDSDYILFDTLPNGKICVFKYEESKDKKDRNDKTKFEKNKVLVNPGTLSQEQIVAVLGRKISDILISSFALLFGAAFIIGMGWVIIVRMSPKYKEFVIKNKLASIGLIGLTQKETEEAVRRYKLNAFFYDRIDLFIKGILPTIYIGLIEFSLIKILYHELGAANKIKESLGQNSGLVYLPGYQYFNLLELVNTPSSYESSDECLALQ